NPSRPFCLVSYGIASLALMEIVGVGRGCFAVQRYGRRGNLKLLINFVWKFTGSVRFGNDHVALILGFGDLQWGNILIIRVYFVEGLGHNLFSVGKLCDSDLEVAFKRNACFVRNLKGVDLLKGDRSTNLYTINLHEMASASPICLMGRASSTKSWLWHQRIRRWRYNLIPAELKFKTPMLNHQDKYIMKAQVHVSKSSAISDVQVLP
nr:integrase, catalytic region, zinc finger, CCHC-type, peptidase aspartic, catalytic [Tanacetum cinerariifolium]